MSNQRCIVVDKPLLKSGCILGEGPLYDESTGTLYFVDIVQKRVYHWQWDTATSEFSIDQFDEPVSCLAPRRNGLGLACVAGKGFGIIDRHAQRIHYLSQPLPDDQSQHIRFNDGACDSRGRFFAGTICSRKHSLPGMLYRYDPSTGSTDIVDEGPFTDCNGCGWSADERTFYLTDSLENRIYAYDYNVEDGSLSNRRLFVDTLAVGLPEGTFPDGLCLDSEGCIWSARWGGSKVVRHGLDGTVDFEVLFPTALNVTACCFGGPNNDQLFVTTAHCGAIGGDASMQERYPDSGNVFQVDLSGRFRGGRWRYPLGA